MYIYIYYPIIPVKTYRLKTFLREILQKNLKLKFDQILIQCFIFCFYRKK